MAIKDNEIVQNAIDALAASAKTKEEAAVLALTAHALNLMERIALALEKQR